MYKLCFLFLSFTVLACSHKPQEYTFACQTPKGNAVIFSVLPILHDMNYAPISVDSAKNIIISEKLIQTTSNSKGMKKEFIQMRIEYNFGDADSSRIIPYYVVEQNNRRKTSNLTKIQQEIYRNDFLLFIEKMNYYCDPRFEKK